MVDFFSLFGRDFFEGGAIIHGREVLGVPEVAGGVVFSGVVGTGYGLGDALITQNIFL